MDRINECPVCGFRLKGGAASGYRCLKCHAHYSAKFVRRLRRTHFSALIDRHFSEQPDTPQRVEIEQERIFVPEPSVVAALDEAKEMAGERRLEDFLELSELPRPHGLLKESFEPAGLLQETAKYVPVNPMPMRAPKRAPRRTAKKTASQRKTKSSGTTPRRKAAKPRGATRRRR